MVSSLFTFLCAFGILLIVAAFINPTAARSVVETISARIGWLAGVFRGSSKTEVLVKRIQNREQNVMAAKQGLQEYSAYMEDLKDQITESENQISSLSETIKVNKDSNREKAKKAALQLDRERGRLKKLKERLTEKEEAYNQRLAATRKQGEKVSEEKEDAKDLKVELAASQQDKKLANMDDQFAFGDNDNTKEIKDEIKHEIRVNRAGLKVSKDLGWSDNSNDDAVKNKRADDILKEFE